MSGSSILIVGNGFAGFWAAVAAKRVVKEKASVTVISPSPVLQLRPRLYQAAPETHGVDVGPLFDRIDVRHLKASVTAIDPDKSEISLAARTNRLAYDQLVLATGSRSRRPRVDGAELAWSIDDQAEAIRFDIRLREIAMHGAVPAIVIVGAGFTGIELALELRDRLAGHGCRHSDAARLMLIDRAWVVGAELGDNPRPLIEQALSAARIETLLGSEIVGMSDHFVTFADGTQIDADAVIITTGMIAAEQPKGLRTSRDALGRLPVDFNLRLPEHPDIFVAGDAAVASTGDPEGHLALQSCQHALQLGRVAGENAARSALDLPLLGYRQSRYVTCLDLGREGALYTEGWSRDVRMSGAMAKALKRRINTTVITPPLHATAEELLALSDTDPARQTYSPSTKNASELQDSTRPISTIQTLEEEI